MHGAFFCAREAAKHMIEKNVKGSIILVSSMSANVRAFRHAQNSSIIHKFGGGQIVNVPQVSTIVYGGPRELMVSDPAANALQFVQSG